MTTEKKILGFPVRLFIAITVLVFIAGYLGWMENTMIGAWCFALFVGTALGEIGNRIPVWKTWFGGGMLFTCLVVGAMNTFKLLNENTIKALNTFNGSTGFLNLYILCLICGAVLSVDRKLLLKSFAGFIPTILAGVVCALGLAAVVGAVTGVGAMNAVTTFAIPIMGGGNGAGIQPMSKMWAAATGGDASSWYASAFAIISLGNLVAVFSAAVLNKVGNLVPSINGSGELMKAAAAEASAEKKEPYKPTLGDYACGFALALFLYNLAHIFAAKCCPVNVILPALGINPGFTIHKFAYMVIFAAILNLSDILPENVKAGAMGVQKFFVQYMSFPLMVTVGIGTNLTDYIKVFTNPMNLLVIIATVLGAMLGTAIFSKIVGFYPIEGMITAGLCMANGGGSGDVQVLGACNRMSLMSYAQISSRIGGAIMLVVASIFFGML